MAAGIRSIERGGFLFSWMLKPQQVLTCIIEYISKSLYTGLLFSGSVQMMVNVRTILLATVLMTLCNGHAMAYQYGYYSPDPYSAPRAYRNPYARAPYPYYPVYRYQAQSRPAYARPPVQVPAMNATRVITAEQGTAKSPSVSVDVKTVTSEKAEKTVKHDSMSTGKKQEFMTTLLPYIEKENRRLITLRKRVSAMFDKLETDQALSTSEQQQVSKLAKKYRVKGDPLLDLTAREELLRKIDIIPSSLALAQAANESAWGKSRFAQQANNLFGIWTYDQDKGLKPKRREEGKNHLVRIFDDFGESVRYYMYTLNSHPAYQELRQIRQQLRVSKQVIEGPKLAAGLEKYSAKGQAYIELIQGLIEQNEWALLDTDNQRA
jgi:Bax protein